MIYQHQQLASGRWAELTFFEQMANIGSEVERAMRWKRTGNQKYSQLAFERALELLDLTISDGKNFKRLREVIRVREILADYFAFNNDYHSTDKSWKNYFYSFNYASRLGR
ncbi:MAG: hypothetical protein UU95_C0016G0001 [Parcubacteria group bacterium GW2011_GWC2_42_12]|nr:MAG: hypothetical protein UU95_C0016G0001 [Parcubacteria group bacterium GW2011_GWC2_42_12]